MSTEIDTQVEALKAQIDSVELETMEYSLFDAIREGATVSTQAYGWTDRNGAMCALSASIVAAKARGYM